MPPPHPLRTAIIGLSNRVSASWAAVAHLPALNTPTGLSKFRITALLNSDADAAKLAVSAFNLPASTKAYGRPEDLAADPDVDVVICNTRVDKHYETILPSVKAGKDVYVEWPIASNAREIEELVREAKGSGARVAVGLQGRLLPPVVRLRELLRGGELGKVLSSEVRIVGGTNDREIVPVALKYFAQRAVGGNTIVINFGHVYDAVLSVLGEFEPGTVHTKLQLQRPTVKVRDPKTSQIVETVQSDVPDLLSLHGRLQESAQTQKDATLSMLFRRGQPFPGTPPLTWTINCELGEIRLVSPSGTSLFLEAPHGPPTIQVHRFATDEVVDVPWAWGEEQEGISSMARGVMNALCAFADGGEGWVGIEEAARRAAEIEGFLAGWEKSVQ